MANYTKSSPSFQGRYYKITLAQDTYDSAAGTVNVNWTFECLGGTSSYYSAPATSIKAYNPADGTTTTIYSHSKTMYSGGTASFPIAKGSRTGTKTFNTNEDGTLTLTITFVKDSMSFSGSTWSSCNYSEDWTLDQIPRASTIATNVSEQFLGSGINITVTKKANAFTHVITILDGSTVKETFSNTDTSNSSYVQAWTPSLNTYGSSIVSSKQYTISCQTYKNATQTNENKIGSPATQTILLKFPSSGYAPTCSLTISANNENFPSTQGETWPADSSMYVQYKSKINVHVGFTGQYGATLSSRTSTVEGASSSNENWVSNILTQSGTGKTVTASVTDNRNRTGNDSKTYNVIPYFTPQITKAEVSRTDTQLTVEYTYNIAPVNFDNVNRNAHWFKIEYKKVTENTWTTLVNNTTDYSKTDQTATATIDQNSSYDIKFTVHDSYGSIPISRQVGTAFDLMNFNASGLAMAIGKVSEAGSNEKLFEVGIPSKFYDGIQAQIQAIANTTSSITGGNSAGRIKWLYNVNNGTTNLFPAQNNANAIMHINKHSGNYDSQLGFSSNGYMYYKNCNGTTLDSQNWKRIAFDSDIPSIPAATNYLQRYSWWNSGSGQNVNDLHGGTTFAYTGHNCPTNGTIVSFDCLDNSSYTLQLQGSYSGDNLYFRNRNGDNNTWRGWSLLAKASDLPSTATVTPTITKSSGNGNVVSGTISAFRYGNICTLFFYFNTSGGTVNAGSNVMSGSISGIPAPATTESMGLGFYGSSMYILSFHNDGTFVIRNIATQLAKNSERHGIGIVYVCS